MRAPLAVIVGGAAAVAVLAGAGFAAQAALDGRGESAELIHNGGFDDGAAYWWTSGEAVTAAAGPVAGEGNVLRVRVPGGSSNPWDRMVGQTGFSLVRDRGYVLKFAARSDRPMTIRVTVQQEQAPYAIELDQQVQLEKDKREFELPFTAGENIDGAALTFQLGGADGDASVMLDAVSTTDGKKPDDSALMATAAGAAVVSVGAFGMHVRRRRLDASGPGRDELAQPAAPDPNALDSVWSMSAIPPGEPEPGSASTAPPPEGPGAPREAADGAPEAGPQVPPTFADNVVFTPPPALFPPDNEPDADGPSPSWRPPEIPPREG